MRREQGVDSPEKARRRRFWTKLIDQARAAGHFPEFHERAKPTTSTGLMRTRCLPASDAYIGYWFTKGGSTAGAHMGLTIGSAFEPHAARSARLAAKRAAIEAALGGELIHFDQGGAGKTSYLYTPVRGGDIEDEAGWDELIPRMTDALARFHAAVAPHLDALEPPPDAP